MLPTLPKIIIFDIRPEYQSFVQQAKPFLEQNGTDPQAIVEDLWEAMFDQDTADERMLEAVCEATYDKEAHNVAASGPFFSHVHGLAQSIYDRVNGHELYEGRGYIPYNLSLRENGLLILERDDEIEKTQQEWLVQEGMIDSPEEEDVA